MSRKTQVKGFRTQGIRDVKKDNKTEIVIKETERKRQKKEQQTVKVGLINTQGLTQSKGGEGVVEQPNNRERTNDKFEINLLNIQHLTQVKNIYIEGL